MTIGPSPVCMRCKFFNKDDFYKNSCEAFPDGIPDEILYEGNKHLKPIPGQKNKKIVFKYRKVSKK